MTGSYVICIVGDDDPPIALAAGKIYRTLPDDVAAQYDLIRVIDESEEDYLYPTTRFVAIELPEAAERALYTTK